MCNSPSHSRGIAGIILGCDFRSTTGAIIDCAPRKLHLSIYDIKDSEMSNSTHVLLCAAGYNVSSTAVALDGHTLGARRTTS